jgi:pimeloyl-ACP methyl ester carboxylesterase
MTGMRLAAIASLLLFPSAACVSKTPAEGSESDARPPAPAVSASPAPAALASAAPAASVAALPAPAAVASGPAVVERVPVPNDTDASVVRGAAGSPPRTVFLPGVCSNANAYLYGFPEAARAHGGVLAIEGDRACAHAAGFRTFSHDIAKLDARIEASLAAVTGGAEPAGSLTLVGYSLGATLAEELVARRPDRYVRLVLIGAPKDARPELVKTARAVATMSCALDVPPRMKAGARRVAELGIPARYFEMPRCTHGLIEDGDRVFGDTFAWLEASAAP